MESGILTIRVRYCGGCNPEIDRASVVSRLGQIMLADGVRSVFRTHGEADWLLLINGCPRACLEEEDPGMTNGPRCISVEGSHIHYRPVAEEELPQTIWRIIDGTYSKDHKPPERTRLHGSNTL
ncbi:MAG: hypothetical protein WBG50_29175 [Desulfomonilaceae bacterium]